MILKALAMRDFRVAGSIIREETINGRAGIVVPVVAMVEGVHQGISAPDTPGPRSFYSFAELSAGAQSLEGAPFTLHHPMNATSLVSARSAEGQSFVIGFIRNVQAANNRLSAEAWIDVEKLSAMSASTLEQLRAGTPLSVSLGALATWVAQTGTWNNEAYDEVATNITFDHLALLPGADGACSWADGCGVRANKKMTTTAKETSMNPVISFFMTLFSAKPKGAENEARVTALISAKGSPFTEENRKALMELPEKVIRMFEMSFDEIRTQLWGFVNGLDSPEFINFLEDAYEGYFVYRSERRSGMAGTSSTTLYKRSYSIDANTNKVTVADDVAEVTKQIEYVPVGTSTANLTPNQENAVKDQLIKDLIACDRTPYSDEDRSWLTGLSECQLKKLNAENYKSAEPTPAANAAPGGGSDGKPTEGQPAAAPEKPVTTEQFLQTAPPEVGKVIKRAMAFEAAQKARLVEKLVAHEGFPYSKEELESKEIDELEKLALVANVQVEPTPDYSGQGGTQRVHAVAKVPEMPSTAPEKK